MKILALDLSTKITGYAIFEDSKLVDYGCITASQSNPIDRIQKIIIELDKIIIKHGDISKVYAEEVRPEGTGYGVGNLHTHRLLMYTQAAVAFLLHNKYPTATFDFIYPSSWRSACGIKNGRGIKRDAAKAADIKFVQETFGLTVNDDIADAIGLGYSQISNNAW